MSASYARSPEIDLFFQAELLAFADKMTGFDDLNLKSLLILANFIFYEQFKFYALLREHC